MARGSRKDRILKPARFTKGAGAYLVAPSARPISLLELKKYKSIVEKIGLEPIVGEHVMYEHGYLAGTDQERLKDLNQAIESKNVEAIFFVRGGYGALRILPGINYDALIKNPKLIMGSGDATSILLSIHSKTNLNVFYGPNLDSIESIDSLEFVKSRILSSGKIGDIETNLESIRRLNLISNIIPTPIYDEVCEDVEGRLIGGNLTSIASLMGTPYEVSFKDKIVILNDQDERSDILMRWIVQLSIAGKLQEARAVLFGQFHNCNSRGSYSMHSIQDMIIEHMDKLKVSVPYMVGFPLNEGGLPNPIPIGVRAKIDAKHGVLKFLESATQ